MLGLGLELGSRFRDKSFILTQLIFCLPYLNRSHIAPKNISRWNSNHRINNV